MYFNEILSKFKNAKRPMKLRFTKPEKHTKKHEDIEECPGKVLEWKLGYISF